MSRSINRGVRQAPPEKKISRKSILGRGAGLVAVASLTPALVTQCSEELVRTRPVELTRLDDTIEALMLLRDQSVSVPGAWTPAHMFEHCAQSIAYSMDGFPELNSWLFRNTVGPIAKSKFISDGSFTHDLNEPIPGAPAIENVEDHAPAVDLLIGTIRRFQRHSGALKPHFAFGEATHGEYEQLHSMHVADHLSAMQIG